MKYLILTKTHTPIPQEKRLVIYQLLKKGLNEALAGGFIDCVYAFYDTSGILIANADSHDDIMDALRESPLAPYAHFEVKPLLDFNRYYDKLIAMLQN